MKRATAVVALLLGMSALVSANGPGLSLEEVLRQHLAAIGPPEARNAARTRTLKGLSKYKAVISGAPTLDGAITISSAGSNLRVVIDYKDKNYLGEDLLTSGKRVLVRQRYVEKINLVDRSMLGWFLYEQEVVLRDGLFAGVLSTAWPLLDPKASGARLSYNGVKKVDGTELHEIAYERKSSDLDIRLYFDSFFRHVLTVYEFSRPSESPGSPGEMRIIGNVIVSVPRTAPGVPPARYRLEQRFSDFRPVDGLTLPMQFTLKITGEIPTGFAHNLAPEGYNSGEAHYTNRFNFVENNVHLDPLTFQMK